PPNKREAINSPTSRKLITSSCVFARLAGSLASRVPRPANFITARQAIPLNKRHIFRSSIQKSLHGHFLYSIRSVPQDGAIPQTRELVDAEVEAVPLVRALIGDRVEPGG